MSISSSGDSLPLYSWHSVSSSAVSRPATHTQHPSGDPPREFGVSVRLGASADCREGGLKAYQLGAFGPVRHGRRIYQPGTGSITLYNDYFRYVFVAF